MIGYKALITIDIETVDEIHEEERYQIALVMQEILESTASNVITAITLSTCSLNICVDVVEEIRE